jgi:hypothetical protein
VNPESRQPIISGFRVCASGRQLPTEGASWNDGVLLA